jgi:hypothetical protein
MLEFDPTKLEETPQRFVEGLLDRPEPYDVQGMWERIVERVEELHRAGKTHVEIFDTIVGGVCDEKSLHQTAPGYRQLMIALWRGMANQAIDGICHE